MEQEMNRPIEWDSRDRICAWVYLLAGYLFILVFTSEYFERNISLYTIFYGAVVLTYVYAKGRKPTAESYFWLAVMMGIGIPYSMWSVFYFFQVLALMAVAAYWTLSVTGRLLESGRTSQWVAFDIFNACILVPFSNFSCQMKVLFGRSNKEIAEYEDDKPRKMKAWKGVVLGVFLTIPVLLFVLPLLSSADAAFADMIRYSGAYVSEYFLETILRIIFSLPVSAYLFGLVYGGVRGKNTDKIDQPTIRRVGDEARILPDMTIYTMFGIICFVYLLFIWLQAGYLFSAFTGIRPVEFTYAEYARRGFFELCAIAAFNIGILLFTGLLAKTKKEKNPALRFWNTMLSLLTILLIATAMSKMGMYISVYGLTVKRILTMVFMIWMLIVFICEIVRQWKVFPMVRSCVFAGAVLFVLLCVVPVEKCVLGI